MSRNGRFKSIFVNKEQLQKEILFINSVSELLQNIKNEILKKDLTPIQTTNDNRIRNSEKELDALICAWFFILALSNRYPRKWISGGKPISDNINIPTSNLTKVINDKVLDYIFQQPDIKFNLGNTFFENLKVNKDYGFNLEIFLNKYSFRGVPYCVNQTLLMWISTEYNLELMINYIPSNAEVFEMQIKGKRCVSLLTAPEYVSEYIMGKRDYFGFLLHDLIHASHFFFDKKAMLAQRGFLKMISSFYYSKLIQYWLNQDAQFKTEVEYLISDMNSHVMHLVLFLYSSIERAFDRKTYPINIPNSDYNFNKIETIWESIVNSFSVSSYLKIYLKNIKQMRTDPLQIEILVKELTVLSTEC